MPALEMEELRYRALAAMIPHYEEDARREFLDDLNDATDSLRPKHPPVQVIRYDPLAAAEWYRSMGIEVVSAAGPPAPDTA